MSTTWDYSPAIAEAAVARRYAGYQIVGIATVHFPEKREWWSTDHPDLKLPAEQLDAEGFAALPLIGKLAELGATQLTLKLINWDSRILYPTFDIDELRNLIQQPDAVAGAT